MANQPIATSSARKGSFTVPDPASRVSAGMYTEVRAWLLANDPDAQRLLEWSAATLTAPATPEKLASEVIWVILCAGRSAQAARTIERKVWDAINHGRPVVEAFGYRAKAAAIERAWREREQDFEKMNRAVAVGSAEALVDWCGSIPFIGDDTQFQLAKNLGGDFSKPDRWVCRLAGIPDKPRRAVKYRFPACMALCRPLAEATGDRIAMIDSALWLAAAKGVLIVDANAGPVLFDPEKRSKERSIFDAAPSVRVT